MGSQLLFWEQRDFNLPGYEQLHSDPGLPKNSVSSTQITPLCTPPTPAFLLLFDLNLIILNPVSGLMEFVRARGCRLPQTPLPSCFPAAKLFLLAAELPGPHGCIRWLLLRLSP